MKQKREDWHTQKGPIDPARFVFIDESAAKTNMTPLRGRALRGQRLYAKAPHGHWQTTSMISAISLQGVVGSMALPGATDGDAFEAYVRQILLPQLKPGQIVVMDNLAAHKRPSVIKAIESVDCEVWFLPPYSPDLNPIEQMWSKVKTLLRRCAARSYEPLMQAIASALAAVTAEDCQGFFAGCGYRNKIS